MEESTDTGLSYLQVLVTQSVSPLDFWAPFHEDFANSTGIREHQAHFSKILCINQLVIN